MVTVDELKEMLIPVRMWKEMLNNSVRVVSLEEFVRGQSYNLPTFGDSVDVINAKLEQLSKNLVSEGYQLKFDSYKNLFDSVKELSENSSAYKVSQSFIDSSGIKHDEIPDELDTYVASFKMEIVRK